MTTTPRLTAADFAPEVLDLFDQYVHGSLSRRGFLDGAQRYATGAAGAAGLLAVLSPQFAAAQQIAPGDARITARWQDVDSPLGTGKVHGYLVTPVKATAKLPVKLTRGGEKISLDLELGPVAKAIPATPTEVAAKRLGIKVMPVGVDAVAKANPQLHGGLAVVEVTAGSVAANAGIQKGDVLVGLHSWETLRVDDVSASIWPRSITVKGVAKTLYSVTFERSYKTEFAYKYTRSFDPQSLPRLVEVIRQTEAALKELRPS